MDGPEFYPDEGMGSIMGPPRPPAGTGRTQAPAVRMVLADPEAAGRPYVIRAEAVHDSGIESVELHWSTDMELRWTYRCGDRPPAGVRVSCTQLGYTYAFVVIPPAGDHSFGVSARARSGTSASRSVGARFQRCRG